jgi:hypothetical protein
VDGRTAFRLRFIDTTETLLLFGTMELVCSLLVVAFAWPEEADKQLSTLG